MSGVIPLSKIQFGRESTLGTEVDAVDILRVEGAFLDDQREIQFVPENVGLLVDPDRTTIPFTAGAIAIPENNVTFEQILHILEMGIRTVSSAQDGAGSGYIWTYNLPTTAQLTPKTYTFEGGDDEQASVLAGCFVESFTISGRAKEPLKFTANIFGRQVDDTTFTAALTIPTVEEALFQKCKFYLDDAGDGFGATQVENYLLGFTLNINTGFKARATADGNLYYSYLKQTKPEFSLSLMVEHDSSADAEITKARAQTARLARILCQGSALTSAGTSYTYKTIIIDLAGKYAAIPPIENDDGSSVMNFTLNGRYNSTISTMGKIIVVNETDDLDGSVS